MPKVSVLIPAYNCSKYLPGAMDSALKQTFQDFEILVIDDGSTDGSAQLVQEISGKHPGKIRYFYQENQGLAMARNKGLKESRGTYIALFDSDDVWFPERLEEGIKVIESDPRIGLVHANMTRIDGNSETIDTPQRNRWFLKGNMFENIFLRRADVPCPTVLFRKACCDTVGIFDPNLTRLGCEDRDLWLRIAQKYKIVYIHKILAYYRMSPQSMSQNFDKMIKARLYVVDKYCPQGSGSERLRNKALSKIYRDVADEALIKGDLPRAKQYYHESIHHDLFAYWSWINLTKTMYKKTCLSI
jgi:glycosyltransferase involved in cell wall biosynthesis